MYNFDLRKKKNSITKIALLIMHQGQLERKKKTDQRLHSIRVCYNSQYALCYVRKSEKKNYWKSKTPLNLFLDIAFK